MKEAIVMAISWPPLLATSSRAISSRLAASRGGVEVIFAARGAFAAKKKDGRWPSESAEKLREPPGPRHGTMALHRGLILKGKLIVQVPSHLTKAQLSFGHRRENR